MSPPSFTLSPSWPHYAGVLAITLSIFTGVTRYILADWSDPKHCSSLMNKGSWLDSTRKNWQPDGCMLHPYTDKEASTCLDSRPLVFIGDSITRKLFFQTAHILDSTLPTSPPDDQHKHSDHILRTKAGSQVSFFWDPFLNSSRTRNTVLVSREETVSKSSFEMQRPALLVLGSGLWYLRYANTSGGLPSWEANMEFVLNSLARGDTRPADEVVVLPVEQIVTPKLSYERANSMRSSDIDAMNSDLLHRIHPSGGVFSGHPPSIPVSLPLVFNQMLDPSSTEDGLHFSDALIRIQANILLNLRCNDVLPKRFPLNKTCCRSYPWPSALHLIVLGLAVLWGPYIYFISSRRGQRALSFARILDEHSPALVFSISIALIYIADRTGLWLKEQKQFDPWTFTFLCLVCLVVGFATVKRTDKDLGFLNRDQTDEWKGWMQLAILIYHYIGASKISGIYNPIRVLVASYLFMTGYGHGTYYIRKADFSFSRIAYVMVRLNLLTLTLAYTMNTDYISYYFAPLVSMWFIVIYATMAIGSQHNDNATFLVFKLLLSAGLITWFMNEAWPIQTAFDVLSQICGIHWSAREWAFRVNLDLWIVYVGIFAALAVIKIREHRLTDHPYWPTVVKAAICTSVAVMVWFFAFELSQQSKFTYNLWHPYISFLPVLAFAVLRNANSILRSGSSRFFAFIGKCSLETFILQYHIWMAGDSKGILLVIPGTQWRPINFIIATTMFIYLSDRVAQATGDITAQICRGTSQSASLPTTALVDNTRFPLGRRSEAPAEVASMVSLASSMHKEGVVEPLSRESDAPARWVDRLANGTSPPRSSGFRVWYDESGWNLGVKTKLVAAVVGMWLLNVIWPYP